MQRCCFFLVVFLSLHATGQFPVRLVGGPNLCVGRVELFHQGEWGTVCDDDWDMRDAAVVCRELDCGEALSAPHGAWFGEGAGPIWLNEVHCAGTEWHLHSCHHLGFRKHVCTHEEDASAICSEQRFPPFTAFPPHTTFRRGKMEAVTTARPLVSHTPAQGSPALRLVGGRSHCSGRVEVFHEGQWGTVCDDMWDLLDVAVVCRELDCGEALAAPGGAFFGEGNSVIWLDDVQCQGEESALMQCHTSAWGTNNCRHSEDAGAVCSGEMPLAMVEERVAMLTRTLAPQRIRTAAPKRIPRPTQPSRPQEEPVANEVSQTEKKQKESLSEDALGGRWQVRLVEGPGSCAGRVEVLYKDQWGTVCDDGWDLVDAAVVCRELGCGAPLLSPGNARYGPGTGPIWLDDVNCTGSEFTLRRCRSQPWGKHNCNHHEDASVICTGKWKRLSLPKSSRDSAKSTSTTTTTTTSTTPTPTTATATTTTTTTTTATTTKPTPTTTATTPTTTTTTTPTPTTSTTTTIPTTTTQDSRPVDGPGLQSTLDVPETSRATWGFSDEWKTETLQPRYTDKPLGVMQNVELELEQNTKPASPMDIAETTSNPEILQPAQEMESTSIPGKLTTTYKWVQKATEETMPNPEFLQHVQEMSSTSPPKTKLYTNKWEHEPTLMESQPSSTVLDLESKRERETTTQQGMDKAVADLETLQKSQEMESPSSPKKILSPHKWGQKPTSATVLDLESKRETEITTHFGMDKTKADLETLKLESTGSPKTRPSPHKWGQKPIYATTEHQPSSTELDLESERETEMTTYVGMDKTISDLETLQNSQEMDSTSNPKSTTSPHKWEQKLIYATTESWQSSAMWDLESKREIDTTTPRAMDRTIPEVEILQHGQEMELTSFPKSMPSSHKWGQKPTSASIEFLPPVVIGDLKFERDAEPTSPSEMELPTEIEMVKPATDMLPPMHQSNMSEVPHITQEVEPINPVAEAQPTTAVGIRDSKDRETTDNTVKELVLFAKSLESTVKIELPTATENIDPVKHMETTSPSVPDSRENTRQKQDGSDKNLYTMQTIESIFTLNDKSSLDETDVHNTTEQPQSPASHTVSANGQSEDGLLTSGDTESGTSYIAIVSAPSKTKTPSPKTSSAETVTNPAKLSEPSPGYPIKQDQGKERQDFCCSSPVLGNLIQAVEGLRGDLSSLSTTIQHQHSQMEAIALSLGELAASVRHLVGVLPKLGLQASVPSSSALRGQDEDQLQNQLPLK